MLLNTNVKCSRIPSRSDGHGCSTLIQKRLQSLTSTVASSTSSTSPEVTVCVQPQEFGLQLYRLFGVIKNISGFKFSSKLKWSPCTAAWRLLLPSYSRTLSEMLLNGEGLGWDDISEDWGSGCCSSTAQWPGPVLSCRLGGFFQEVLLKWCACHSTVKWPCCLLDARLKFGIWRTKPT